MVQEAGSLKSGGSVSDEGPGLVAGVLCPHLAEGEGSLWAVFYKDAHPIHGGSALLTYWPPRGFTFQKLHFGG